MNAEQNPDGTEANPKTPREPPKWREIYEMMRELRKEQDAPVDTVGCEAHSVGDYTEQEKQFHVLVSLMLSSQTKDQITHEAVGNLKRHGLTIGNILQTPDSVLNGLIRMVGFHNNKTRFLKQTCQILRDKHNDQVPSNIEDLLALPGVGPKMAHLVLNCAFGMNSGIGVDTHVHRICNQLAWVKTKTPEQTRVALELWLPKEFWTEINKLLVGLGQLVQTDPMRLIRKGLLSSNPPFALQILRRIGVKMDALNKDPAGDKETALIWAVKQNRADLVQLLQNHGASKYAKDSLGKCAVDYAIDGSAVSALIGTGKPGLRKRKRVKVEIKEEQVKKEDDLGETKVESQEGTTAGESTSSTIEADYIVKVKMESTDENVENGMTFNQFSAADANRAKRRRT